MSWGLLGTRTQERGTQREATWFPDSKQIVIVEIPGTSKFLFKSISSFIQDSVCMYVPYGEILKLTETQEDFASSPLRVSKLIWRKGADHPG